jgi:hypothetical protein
VEQHSSVVVVGASKSVAVAIILAFFFGPLGMLYATVAGFLVMFLINVLGLCTGSIFFVLPVTWVLGIIWAAIAAAQWNSRLTAVQATKATGRN